MNNLVLCTLHAVVEILFYKLLTVAVPIEQERILQLELQIFVYWLHQVLCTESVHNSEAMVRRGRPWKNRLQTLKKTVPNITIACLPA